MALVDDRHLLRSWLSVGRGHRLVSVALRPRRLRGLPLRLLLLLRLLRLRLRLLLPRPRLLRLRMRLCLGALHLLLLLLLLLCLRLRLRLRLRAHQRLLRMRLRLCLLLLLLLLCGRRCHGRRGHRVHRRRGRRRRGTYDWPPRRGARPRPPGPLLRRQPVAAERGRGGDHAPPRQRRSRRALPHGEALLHTPQLRAPRLPREQERCPR